MGLIEVILLCFSFCILTYVVTDIYADQRNRSSLHSKQLTILNQLTYILENAERLFADREYKIDYDKEMRDVRNRVYKIVGELSVDELSPDSELFEKIIRWRKLENLFYFDKK